jgi:4-amino-4-deoxy-L-arabinose transferase-like glycosyltransferase
LVTTRGETSSLTKRRLAVLFPVLLTAAVIMNRYHQPGITADGVTYLQIARNILLGKGLGWQALWAPPLHSVLIAAVSAIGGIRDLLAAAGIVAPIMFFCLVLAVFYLAFELFDLRTALVASLFTALSPHLLFIGFYPEAEITYTFFLTLALGFTVLSVTRRSAGYAAAMGISFALAWMSRSEGFIVMALVAASLLAVQGRRFYRSAVFKNILLATLFFLLAASPYLFFLKQHYGAWVISPKSTYVMIWMKSRIYHDNNKGEVGNDDLWGLTPDGRKLRWQEPKGIADLAGYLLSHPGKSISVYLHNLGMEVPGRIPNNSGMENYPQPYPIYIALAALLAVFVPWGEFAREKRVALLAPLLIFFILPVFTEGWWKYLVPYLPVVLILAARGFSAGAEIVGRKISFRHENIFSTGILAMTAGIIGVRFILALYPVSFGPPGPPAKPSADIAMRRSLAEEARQAGQWGAQHFGPGKNYMVSWSKIVYYLDGLWTAFPVADYREVLKYARGNGVDYIVVELMGGESREDPGRPPYGLELAGLYKSAANPYAVAFYRLTPW